LHAPVLVREVLHWLRPESGGTFLDCTLGLGGHAEAILEASADARVIGIDRDLEALLLARERLERFGDRLRTVHANFEDLAAVMSDLSITEVQGAIADFGVSSLQLDRAERGFSFSADAPLDMRMDRRGTPTAADLVNRLSEEDLADLIFKYGEERAARKIARAIVRERGREAIATTGRLAQVVVRTLRVPGRWRTHPATRTFQALRIAVNDELAAIERLIPAAISALAPGGRLAAISFHSLEDRIVKQSFQRESGRCMCRPELGAYAPRPGQSPDAGEGFLATAAVCDRCGARKRVVVHTRKPIRPGPAEARANPRSRSARLRVCEKL
jgi:16S rRNA (cytosine1402-N4)-methyltransferase